MTTGGPRPTTFPQTTFPALKSDMGAQGGGGEVDGPGAAQIDSQARQQSVVEKPVSNGGIVPRFLKAQKVQAPMGGLEQNAVLKSGQNCDGFTHEESMSVLDKFAWTPQTPVADQPQASSFS